MLDDNLWAFMLSLANVIKVTLVPYSYWNLKLRDDSNILDIANSIALDSSGRLFSELLSASRTNLSAVSPINTGIVFIDIAIIF